MVSPPRHLWPQRGNFEESARQDVRFLVEVARLRPDHRVLDVGCGTGRLAVGLVDYLGADGHYEGFDVRRDSVAWASEHVAVGDPRFRFLHLDAENRSYNPRGRRGASTVTFPYPDASFDLTVLLSVFTHLVPKEAQHYLSECARVLRSGGRCVSTFFILDAPRVVEMPHRTLPFTHDLGGYFAVNVSVPEDAVAYPEAFVRRAHHVVDLTVETLLPGKWRDPAGPRWQDTVVAVKDHRPT